MAVDRLALDTELPLQRAHISHRLEQFFKISFNQNFHVIRNFNVKLILSDHINEIKSPPKLKTLVIFNTKINQITVLVGAANVCYIVMIIPCIFCTM